MRCFALVAAGATLITTTTSAIVLPSRHSSTQSCQHVIGGHRNLSPSPRKNADRVQERWRRHIAACAAFSALLFSSQGHFSAFAAEEKISMQFENGEVVLSDPLSFGPDLILQRPRFLGSGGGGAVFAFERSSNRKENDVVVKVSWLRSATSVERECSVLQVMERNNVQGVETCLGKERYPNDERRVMIVMAPVIEDSVASVSEINENLQPHAVVCIIRSMVQMLATRVVTTDVQPLISQSTGEVLFIDMTEAKVMSQDDHLPFLDVALASSFVTEMLTLIPESETLYKLASTQLFQELQEIEAKGVHLSDQVYDLLRSQTQFISRESLEYIDGRIGPA